MSADDQELLTRWQSGDAAAGNRLVTRHFRLVYRFFIVKVGDAAEDLTQQTFLACVESHERFRGDGSFRSFVLGIARYKLLGWLRARRRQDVSVDDIDGGERSLFELTGSLSRAVRARQEQRTLLLALRRLPLDLQIAVELHYWEDMTTAEIADVLQIPRGTVKTRLMRGRTRLRDLVEELAGTPEVREATVRDIESWARSLRSLDGLRPAGDEGE